MSVAGQAGMVGQIKGPVVSITPHSVFGSGSTGPASTAAIRVNNSGALETKVGAGSYTPVGGSEWLVSGLASDVEVMFDNLTGDTPTGTFNTWLAPSGSPIVSLVNPTPATTLACSFRTRFRPVGGGADLDSDTINLSAERT